MATQQRPGTITGALAALTSSLPSRPAMGPRCTTRCIHPAPNTRAEHCHVCHRTFTCTSAGDRHRTGRHGIDRRCLTEAEMLDAGLAFQARRGMWAWAWKLPKRADSGLQEGRYSHD